MTLLEWSLEAGLVLALAATLPVTLRLERALSSLRRDREALSATVQGFAEATREAEAAIARLRAAAETAGRGVAEQVTAANALREDLRFLSERAESLADRLDQGVRASRQAPAVGGATRAPVSAPATAPRTRAEQDLLRALGQGIFGQGGRGE